MLAEKDRETMKEHLSHELTLKKVLCEFCETTSIHGVRYLGRRRIHWLERIWWIVAVSVSIFFCAKLLERTWYKKSISPVIITIDNEATQISDIPFPTITICSNLIDNRFYLNNSRILELSDVNNYENITIEKCTIQKHSAVANFCDLIEPYLDQFKEFNNFTFDPHILPLLEAMTPNLLAHHSYCSLEGSAFHNCDIFFDRIVTDLGLCHTFNHLDSNNIYNFNILSDDFPKVNTKINESLTNWNILNTFTYPYRMKNSGIGLKMKLTVPLNKSKFDGQCRNNFDGFKMQIHSAEEVPHMKKHFIHIPYDHDIQITVNPKIVNTVQNLIDNYGPKQRKCINDNENQLMFFKKYTQQNCRLEDLANQVKQQCGCVLFWMPRHNGTNICHFNKQFKCVIYAAKYSIHANSTSQCLPACYSIDYDADISTSKLLDGEMYDEQIRRVTISIVFKEQQYFASMRSELYGTMDFIAACGGILSLFMGISILNLIEVIYFATLRFICLLREK